MLYSSLSSVLYANSYAVLALNVLEFYHSRKIIIAVKKLTPKTSKEVIKCLAGKFILNE